MQATENSELSFQRPLTLKNFNLKISILIVAFIHFLQQDSREDVKVSIELILCDHLLNSHYHSVL